MRIVLALAALTLAGGCLNSGEPGEDDIRGALVQAGNRGGPKAVKLACKRGSDRPGFVCDYRAPVCSRFTNGCGSARPGSGRFVKSGGRWQLVEDLSPRPNAAPGTNPPPVSADSPAPSAIGPGITFSPVPADGPAVASPPPPVADEPLPRQLPPPAVADDGRDDRRALRPRDVTLIARWVGLNARCRIGDDAGEEEYDACLERDDLAQRMRRRGLCYGGGGRDTVAKWHRCE